jgi:hypothetical protein
MTIRQIRRVDSWALALLLAGGTLLCIAGCSSTGTSATSPVAQAGQLFCAVQTGGGGGAVVVALIDAAASGAAPGGGQVAVIATNMGKAYVDAACAGAGGIPVSPPANPAAAPVVAVVVPTGKAAA